MSTQPPAPRSAQIGGAGRHTMCTCPVLKPIPEACGPDRGWSPAQHHFKVPNVDHCGSLGCKLLLLFQITLRVGKSRRTWKIISNPGSAFLNIYIYIHGVWLHLSQRVTATITGEGESREPTSEGSLSQDGNARRRRLIMILGRFLRTSFSGSSGRSRTIRAGTAESFEGFRCLQNPLASPSRAHCSAPLPKGHFRFAGFAQVPARCSYRLFRHGQYEEKYDSF